MEQKSKRERSKPLALLINNASNMPLKSSNEILQLKQNDLELLILTKTSYRKKMDRVTPPTERKKRKLFWK